MHEIAFNCWTWLDKRLITWFSHRLFLCTKNNFGIQLKKGHWLWPLVKRGTSMQKRKMWRFTQRQQRQAIQTIAITSIHPFLYFPLINQGFFSALAAHYWQAPSTLWASASSLARINPLTSQGSRLSWLDLTWQVGRASPQLSPQLPRHVAIIMAAKMKNQ